MCLHHFHSDESCGTLFSIQFKVYWQILSTMGYFIFQSSNLIDRTYRGCGIFCNLDRDLYMDAHLGYSWAVR